MNTLGDEIRQRIEAVQGLSIEKVARSADMPSSQLHRILNGETNNPGVRTLNRIAVAIGVPLETILARVEFRDDTSMKRLVEDALAVGSDTLDDITASIEEDG